MLLLGASCAYAWLRPVSIHVRLLLTLASPLIVLFLVLARLASRRPNWRRPFFIAVLFTPVVLLAGEVVASYVQWTEAQMTAPLRKTIEGQREGMLERSNLANYRLIPSRTYALWGGQVAIDRNGFRSPRDIPLVKPPDSVRVMLVGGSTAFGWGVPDGQDIAAHMQNVLDASGDPGHYEVVNTGVPYYTSFQELNWYVHALWAFKPDILVVLHGHNDALYAVVRGSEWRSVTEGDVGEIPFMPVDAASTRAPTPFLESALMRSALYRQIHRRFREPVLEPLPGVGTPARSETGNVDRRCIEQFVRHSSLIAGAAGREGTRTIFALQPVIYVGKPPTSPEQRILNRLQKYVEPVRQLWPELQASAVRGESGPVHLDLTEIFSGFSDTAYLDNCHYTASANKVLAERLARAVTEQ